MTFRTAAIATMMLFLGACATTDPRSAASFDYRLPRTDAEAKLTLVLRECGPTGFDVSGELTVAASPGAQPTVHRISGLHLASERIKRGFKIAVDENGVIQSVNSEASERTPAIIGNVLKTASVVAGVVFSSPTPAPGCTAEVIAGTHRAALISRQIAQLRADLASSTAPTPADRTKVAHVNALARELAALQTGLLRIETTARINLGQAPTESPQPVAFEVAPFERWFGPTNNPEARQRAIRDFFGFDWSTARAEMIVSPVQPAAMNAVTNLRRCRFTMPLPNPVPVQLTIAPKGASVGDFQQIVKTFPAAQWGANTELCLDVGFGETRSVGLTFDKYGRTTSFAWNSEARAETVSAAVAGMAPDAASIATAIRGPSAVAEQQEEIARLTAMQTLNKLRACQAIIEAGGFDCGDEDEE